MESLSYVNGVQETEHVQQTSLDKDLKPFHFLSTWWLVWWHSMTLLDKDKFCLRSAQETRCAIKIFRRKRFHGTIELPSKKGTPLPKQASF